MSADPPWSTAVEDTRKGRRWGGGLVYQPEAQAREREADPRSRFGLVYQPEAGAEEREEDRRSRCGLVWEDTIMLWEIEIRPRGEDAERQRIDEEYRLLTHSGQSVIASSSRGYLLEGSLNRDEAQQI